ncbi:MAG: molybdopterin oxidoreductase family protein [Pseudomonadota bacterium]
MSSPNVSEPLADETRTTTCYMCACRCGIKVHLKDGGIRYIEGNPDHPVNRGVLCAKGSAGIMQHYSPARLKKPLRRIGPRGSGEFEEIEWDEALGQATKWLGDIRKTSPKKLAFFTGRDQSQALTSWWAQQFGTPNYAAHGGFCSVNMAAAGMYTLGSAFWEFAEPDWDRSRYFMMFGVAEDHGSNPIKIGLSKLKANGARFVSVNPVQTGYSGVANEWLGITPGTDGLFVLSLAHQLLKAGHVDIDYLVRYTNAPFLVINKPGHADDGLLARDTNGEYLCWDRKEHLAKSIADASLKPALKGEFTLADGTPVRPVFALLAQRYLDEQYAPANVAARTGITAETIERIAGELAHAAFDEQIELDIPWTDAWGRQHEKTIGRPVSMHAMRGVSAHANGFQTCRAIHLLQTLLGSIDCPGGLRHKPPYPRSLQCLPRPSAGGNTNDGSFAGVHLGYPLQPSDLLLDDEGRAQRIDKAFTWEAPLAAHGMMHTVLHNAWAGDPYPIDTLFMYMANMAWNSSMNTGETLKYLTDKDESTGEYKIKHIIYSDAYYSETVAYADLILPDTTYLERWDAISLLDRPISDADAVADAIRQPVLKPDRDVRPFQDVLLDLGARLGLSGMTNADGNAKYPDGYSQYIVEHERREGVGTLAGFRGTAGDQSGTGAVNPEQLNAYIKNDCHWREELPESAQYYRHANRAYLDYAKTMGFRPADTPVLINLYSEELQRFRLAAQGHGENQPPEEHRARVETYFDPLPFWYEPISSDSTEDFPLHAITQRPMAMYHSWGSQNAWLRQLHGRNPLYISQETAEQAKLKDGDWAHLSSPHAEITVPVKIMQGLSANTVWTWNAIGKRRGAWNLDKDAPEARQGFLLNHLISDLLPAKESGYRYSNSDPITGQAAWYDLKVRIRRASDQSLENSQPEFPVVSQPPNLDATPTVLRYGKKFKDRT